MEGKTIVVTFKVQILHNYGRGWSRDLKKKECLRSKVVLVLKLSFLSLSNIDFSCSEIELIVSSVSINSSCESSSLSALSLAFPSFNFFASGES